MPSLKDLKEKYLKESLPEHIGTDDLSNAVSPRGQNYLQMTFNPRETSFTYIKHKVFIGKNRKNEDVSLKFAESQRILLLGTSGSGKTFLTGSMIDRAYMSGMLPIILTDLKPEYHVNVFPAKKEMQKFYMPYEKAMGLPMKIYYPRCFLHIINGFENYLKEFTELGIEAIPISITFDQLNFSDFLSLVNKEVSDAQRDLLENLFTRKQEGEIKNLEQFLLELRRSTQYDYKTIATLRNNFDNLLRIEALSNSYGFDLADIIRKKICPVLSLPGWLGLGKNRYYADAFVNLFAREVLRSKMSGAIDPEQKLLIVVDEAARFLNLVDIQDLIDTGRSYGISFLLSS